MYLKRLEPFIILNGVSKVIQKAASYNVVYILLKKK